MCTTFARSPSEISTVTGDFTLLTVQFPSHRGSSLPAVGTDIHTRSPALNHPLQNAVIVFFLPVCRLCNVGPTRSCCSVIFACSTSWDVAPTLWRGSRCLAGSAFCTSARMGTYQWCCVWQFCVCTGPVAAYSEIEGHRIYIRFVLEFLSLISYKKVTQYPFLKLS